MRANLSSNNIINGMLLMSPNCNIPLVFLTIERRPADQGVGIREPALPWFGFVYLNAN